MITFIIILLLFVALYAILRAGEKAQEMADEINRQEYMKRNQLKGGTK